MPLTYVKNAKRQQVWLRAFVMGPSGSGKSLGALRLADQIFEGKLRTTLINSEQRDSGNPYGDRFDLDFIDLAEGGTFSPETYIEALDLAERENPGGVYVIDSVSHEWMGAGGILSLADRFGDWKVVRPRHNAFVERLMALNGHLIATCRAKMKYEVGEEEIGGRKRQVIRMLGVGPIQSDDLQYEFNLVGRFEQGSHDVSWTGHVDPLTDQVANLGDDESVKGVADALTTWLAEGNPLPEPEKAATDKQVEALMKSLHEEGFKTEQIEPRFEVARRENMGVLSEKYVKAQHDSSKKRIAATKADAAEPKPNEASAGEAATRTSESQARDEVNDPDDAPPEAADPVDEAEMDRLFAESRPGGPA